ncbi:lasso peptide biosynthesis protein [Streptomyces sp. NPDC020965]|uniref:lasso peptide biosynthesis protein n=1 Tax=Streptomyces sp. NPDC020965 TaxID=3365105 RepID=UPI0037975420
MAIPASGGPVVRVAPPCRARGSRPTWRTGVRTRPFTARARVEADGRLIGERAPRLPLPPAAEDSAGNRTVWKIKTAGG